MAHDRTREPLGLDPDQPIPSDEGRAVLTPTQRALVKTLLSSGWLQHPSYRECTAQQYVTHVLHGIWLVGNPVLELVVEELNGERRAFEPSLKHIKAMARAAIAVDEELKAIRPRHPRRVPRRSKDAMRPRASDRQG